MYDYSIQHVSINLDYEPWYVWYGRKKKRFQGRHTVPEIKRRHGKGKIVSCDISALLSNPDYMFLIQK